MAAIHALHQELEIPLRTAVRIANQLFDGDESRVRTQFGIELTLDVVTLASSLTDSLADAVDLAPTPRRGRPRKS